MHNNVKIIANNNINKFNIGSYCVVILRSQIMNPFSNI